MANHVGHPKAGGRKKGTPNKNTVRLHEMLIELRLEPVENLRNLLPELQPEKQADIFMKLMEYIYPKRKAIEHTGERRESKMIVFGPDKKPLFGWHDGSGDDEDNAND